MCAIDGSTIADIKTQVRNIPKDATCLFVSVGGNDALMKRNLLYDTRLDESLTADGAGKVCEGFRADYMQAIEQVCRLEKPTCLCTIYNGNMVQDIAGPMETAVAVLNDKIHSVANERHLPVIDLRRICNQLEDYANPIRTLGYWGKEDCQRHT